MAYVYYSYEQWGRGYIGARNKSPVNDPYLGTYSDTTFAPTDKIVLAEFDTFEEALEAECALHTFFDVASNSHFANRAKQTSAGFMYDPTGRTHSAETREKMSATQRGKLSTTAAHTPEANAKRSATLKGRKKSKDFAERAKKFSSFNDPEVQAKARATRERKRREQK